MPTAKSVSHSQRRFKKATHKTSLRSKPSRRRFRFCVTRSVALFLIGLGFIISGESYLISRQSVLSFSAVPAIQTDQRGQRSQPSQIIIPSIGLELPVSPAQIQDGVWQIASQSASHLDSSARPGEIGNMVIYGHNKASLMGNLKQVQLNDPITIKNKVGEVRIYKVVSIQTVKPTEVSVVAPSSHEELTIYTCTGVLDSLRLVVKAKPI